MDTSAFDKDTARAWQGWQAFTRVATWSVIVIAAVLGLMAVFLL